MDGQVEGDGKKSLEKELGDKGTMVACPGRRTSSISNTLSFQSCSNMCGVTSICKCTGPNSLAGYSPKVGLDLSSQIKLKVQID
jgi:hypothetical protein